MFPLGTVLVPGAALPLHVFEPRYRALVRRCLEGEPEFGVVLIERGPEVGGGDTRFEVGCVARIVEAGQFPDGRWALGTVGVRRIRVAEWLPDDPYPRALVEDWPDTAAPVGAEQRRDEALTALRRVLAMAAELGDAVAPAIVEVDDDPTVASHQLTALAPVGPLDRLALLAAPGVDHRYDLLLQVLADAEAVLATRLSGG